MTNRFANSKTLLKQAETQAILDYYELIATYRLTRLSRNYGIEVFEMLNGPKQYAKVVTNFENNILDYNKSNIELLIQLENNLSSLSIKTSLSPSVKAEFSTLDWIDYAIDCLNMESTAKETLTNYGMRINELYDNPSLKRNDNENIETNELVKSIHAASKRFR